MLTSSSFGDDARFSHSARQNNLTQYVVNLMRAGMVKFVAFHIDFGAAKVLCEAFRKIKRAGPANIIRPKIIHFGPETIIGFCNVILLFQFQNKWHQCF